jgi:hypothetical protein
MHTTVVEPRIMGADVRSAEQTPDMLRNMRTLAFAHGGFFLVAGLWPIVHLRSFEFVTGPKADGWLVKTVGTLIAVSGAVIVNAARRDRVTPEVIGLANGVSGALGYISFHYARKGRISRIYFLDALTELCIMLVWVRSALRGGLARSRPDRA